MSSLWIWRGNVSHCLDPLAGKQTEKLQTSTRVIFIPDRSSKCCLELWQHLNALLLFTVGPRAPGVHSEPQFHNNKQSHFGARIKPGTQHASQCEHPTITYRSVLLRSNHLNSQVLLLRGCCSVTCVSVPAGWLECHTSNLGDAVEGNTMCLQPTLVSRQDAAPEPGWVQQCVVLCGVEGQKWKCLHV